MKKNNININYSASKEDFRLFSEGKMNKEQKSDFLKQTEGDEFSKEAMKGFEKFPGSFNDINDIDKSIHTKTQTEFKRLIKRKFFSIISPIILIAVICFFLIHHKTPEVALPNKNEISQNIDFHQINTDKREIEKAVLIPESKQITSVKAQNEQNKVAIFEKSMPVEFIEKLHAISVSGNLSGENANPGIDEHYNNLPTTYMYDLKVVNYSGIYRNKIKKIIPDGGSIPPRFENRQSSSNTISVDENTTSVAYNDFLNDAMGKFSTNNFKEALQDYNTILQQYPDDLNAHFYGGLSYYNIGLNKKAIVFFDAVLENNAITFTQEALWYKALSLINAENTKEAEVLLKKIIESKGFYASRANETLTMIKK